MAKANVSRSDFYVYVLFRHDTAEPFYVGKGQGRRWVQHEMPSHARKNSHKNAIVQKAKRAGVEIPKVKVACDLTEDRAFEIECALIAAIGRRINGGPLVNMSDGGEGQSGHFPSLETRLRISAAGKRRVWPDDYSKEFIARALSPESKSATPETRRKISASKTGTRLSAERRAQISEELRNRGPISAATREKLSAWQRGRPRSAEDRQKMRDGWARRNAALLMKSIASE